MSDYWQRRKAQQMFGYMAGAEETADQIAKLYLKASRYLEYEIKDIFERFRTKHNLSEAEARRLLNQIYGPDKLAELKKLLAAKGEDKRAILTELESQACRARIERLQQLNVQLDLIMRQVYEQEKIQHTAWYLDLASEAYYHSIFEIQKQTGLAFSFSLIDPKKIDRVINSKWMGANYSDRIWKNTQALADTLKEELLVSLVTGRTERETAGIIANRFAVGASKARRLVRTESCYLAAQMDMESYKECGIEMYRFLATLDLKTSEICRELDGKRFLVSEKEEGENCPPMHPWCRSTTTAALSAEDLARLTRRAIDPTTGKEIHVPAGMTYDQWYHAYVVGNPEAELNEKKIRNRYSDRKQLERYRAIIGDDMPKNLENFQNLKYNEPEKWELLRTYARSVKNGMISPLSGFKNYQKIYDEINEKVVGVKTSEGTAVTRQSKHFMERVIGTMKDPKTGRPRSGVTVEGIQDALENPVKVFPVRTDPSGEKSQKYMGRNGTVSVDPDTGVLIQCNPTDSDYVRRIRNGNAKI